MDLAFINELTEEELNELLNAVMAKLDQIANPAETEELEGGEGETETESAPDVPEAAAEVLEEIGQDLDKLEELVEAIEGRKAAIKNAAEKRSALIRRVAAVEKAGNARKIVSETKKEEKGMNNELYRSAWLKNLQGKDLSAEERTALADGAYVIPQETVNKIYGKMELYPLLNAVDVMHIPGTVVLPVEGTVNAANVVAMGQAATDSADTVTSVSLGIYKIIKTVEITADVAAMAVPAFEEWLVDRLANKMYRKITSLIASGSGSSTVTGPET
jgi:HK97 family phage major capsid protein